MWYSNLNISSLHIDASSWVLSGHHNNWVISWLLCRTTTSSWKNWINAKSDLPVKIYFIFSLTCSPHQVSTTSDAFLLLSVAPCLSFFGGIVFALWSLFRSFAYFLVWKWKKESHWHNNWCILCVCVCVCEISINISLLYLKDVWLHELLTICTNSLRWWLTKKRTEFCLVFLELWWSISTLFF